MCGVEYSNSAISPPSQSVWKDRIDIDLSFSAIGTNTIILQINLSPWAVFCDVWLPTPQAVVRQVKYCCTLEYAYPKASIFISHNIRCKTFLTLSCHIFMESNNVSHKSQKSSPFSLGAIISQICKPWVKKSNVKVKLWSQQVQFWTSLRNCWCSKYKSL